jgi:hypothetical protein
MSPPRIVRRRVIRGKRISQHLSGPNRSAASAKAVSDYTCRLNRSMQHCSNLLIRLCFSRRPDPLGCSQLNLDRAVFSLNQRSRTNLAVETPADWTSGRCCVDPLRSPDLPGHRPQPSGMAGEDGDSCASEDQTQFAAADTKNTQRYLIVRE